MIKIGLILILLLPGYTNHIFSQTVIKSIIHQQPLAEQWQWAITEAKQRQLEDGFWIGYSIKRLMSRHSHIGSCHES